VDSFKNHISHVKILFKKLYFLLTEKEKKEERSQKHVMTRATLKRGPNANLPFARISEKFRETCWTGPLF